MSAATSELLRAAYMGRLPDPCRTVRELQALAGYSDTDAARVLGVSPHTFRRWRRDRPPKPTAVRLLAIHAGYVPWPGWRGWEVHDGRLFPPGESHGLEPEQVAAARFLLALSRSHRRSPIPEPVRPRSGWRWLWRLRRVVGAR